MKKRTSRSIKVIATAIFIIGAFGMTRIPANAAPLNGARPMDTIRPLATTERLAESDLTADMFPIAAPEKPGMIIIKDPMPTKPTVRLAPGRIFPSGKGTNKSVLTEITK